MKLASAQSIIAKACAKAESLGLAMCFAVVDAGGHLVMSVRMDGAGWLITDIAKAKACTVIAFQCSTQEISERLGGYPSFLNALNAMHPGIIAIGGGLPIQVDGQIVGAIGASGGTPAQDEECARAGLEAL